MSKTQLLKRALDVIKKRLLSDADDAFKKAGAKRTGLDLVRKPVDTVIAEVRNNPVLAGLLLMEVGTEGAALLAQMRENDPLLDQAVAAQEDLAFEVDDPEEVTVSSMLAMTNEFTAIRDAVNAIGSMEKLMVVRKALSFDDSVFDAYAQYRVLRSQV